MENEKGRPKAKQSSAYAIFLHAVCTDRVCGVVIEVKLGETARQRERKGRAACVCVCLPDRLPARSSPDFLCLNGGSEVTKLGKLLRGKRVRGERGPDKLSAEERRLYWVAGVMARL